MQRHATAGPHHVYVFVKLAAKKFNVFSWQVGARMIQSRPAARCSCGQGARESGNALMHCNHSVKAPKHTVWFKHTTILSTLTNQPSTVKYQIQYRFYVCIYIDWTPKQSLITSKELLAWRRCIQSEPFEHKMLITGCTNINCNVNTTNILVQTLELAGAVRLLGASVQPLVTVTNCRR